MKRLSIFCSILFCLSSSLLQPLYAADSSEIREINWLFDKDSLPDLKIDSIKIVEKPKRFSLFNLLPLKPRNIYVQYTITNIGKGAAKILGDTPNKQDNIALRAYFSGDRKLNKGDFLADGTFLPNNDFPNGELAAGASYTSTMRVSLKSKSRYIAVLILKIDDFSLLEEENETNNTFWYILK